MKNFKAFSPKVDHKRRLVMTRFYTGVKDTNSFCYQINKITQTGAIDKKFKPLYAFGTDDFKSVGTFSHSGNGGVVKIFKTSFKSVFGVVKKNDSVSIWQKI